MRSSSSVSEQVIHELTHYKMLQTFFFNLLNLKLVCLIFEWQEHVTQYAKTGY